MVIIWVKGDIHEKNEHILGRVKTYCGLEWK